MKLSVKLIYFISTLYTLIIFPLTVRSPKLIYQVHKKVHARMHKVSHIITNLYPDIQSSIALIYVTSALRKSGASADQLYDSKLID